jgi:integrase
MNSGRNRHLVCSCGGLVGVIRGDRFESLWVAHSLTLGLPEGALLGLCWSDIDFGNSTLTVRQALQQVGGRLVLVEPKTALSRRTAPVPPPHTGRTAGTPDSAECRRLAAGSSWRDSGLVFTTHLGASLEPRNVNRVWYAVRSRAALPGFRLHDLRLSCARLRVRLGAGERIRTADLPFTRSMA